MKLSSYHKSKGDEVFFVKSANRQLFEPDYDLVYGSAIFTETQKKLSVFRSQFPDAIIGGTGTELTHTVEQWIGVDDYEHYDYSIYPDFAPSIGFSQRGCRLRCKFCVVPTKEGKIKPISTINDIWRGEPHPKHIHLLDNDFFGQPNWEDLCNEAIDGGFKVCFSQGINVRLIHKEGAEKLSQMYYADNKFKRRRIYTAWDNKRDEKIFLRGIGFMLGAGIKPREIMVYFLCNYWEKGLTEDVWYRFNQMVDMGLEPYPMIYDKPNASKELRDFQRWVIRRNYKSFSFNEYNQSGTPRSENAENQLNLI